MPLNWIQEIERVPIDALLLLESCQIGWIDENAHRHEWAQVFRARPELAYVYERRCPRKAEWVARLRREAAALPLSTDAELRAAGQTLVRGCEDWLAYQLDPEIYQRQPHNGWDERELTGLADFSGKRVLDIGSGTGKQAFAVAPLCRELYCVEPIDSLRRYLRARAQSAGYAHVHVHVLDGFLEALPFEDGLFDVVMGGHVFGDAPVAELAEMTRVAAPRATLMLVPGNNDADNEIHRFLTDAGFAWARFEEPRDGWKRKYWKTLA